MEGSYKKSKGNAGLDGVQFQVGVSTVFLLNALRNLKNWRISTENEDAGKFDDVVIELLDGSAILLQAKHKDSKRINKDQLFSDNTKNADFSLPKYFLSYQEVKSKFNVKNIIICTNADVDKKKLKDILAVQPTSPDSILHYEEGGCSFIKFNENILSDLRATSESYYEKNVRNKGIDKEAISDGNLREFIEKLQFFTNYPKGDNLHNVIDQLLARLTDSQLWSDTSSREIFGKVEDWFKQGSGEYLTESRANAMICEIKSDQFCKALKKHDISFVSTDLGFKEGKRIYHVSVERGYLLQALKMFHALQERKTLFVNPENGSEVSKQAVEAFRLPKYEFLVLILQKKINRCLVLEICAKLKDVLDKYTHKKVIFIGNKQNVEQSALKDDIVHIDGSVTISNFTQQCQEKLIRKKNINYQGKNITLKDLLSASTVEGYEEALDSEILEKLVREAEIKVGTPLAGLYRNIVRYYINRTIERETEKEKDEITPSGTRKEIFPERDIFEVKGKFIIISDCAGMGKSTILSKLADNMKEKYPHLWIIRIELNDYSRILSDYLDTEKRTIKITDLLDSNEVTRFSNLLERFVFSMNQKVVVMLDGFDEISPDYTELVLSLLRQCQEGPNFAKVFVTTRPHMNRDLENLLNVKPFMLQPFTATDQIEFLASYWGHNMELEGEVRERCEKYAVALINKMFSWIRHNFTAIPLQIRMLAEIFQEKSKDNSTVEWEGCKEFLDGDKEQPVLPAKMKITELYERFLEKKFNIFLRKANPTGTAGGNLLLRKIERDKYFVSHQGLAVRVILTNETINEKRIHQLFSCFQYDDSIEVNMLKIGIVQMANEKLEFVHRTFAEYFLAKSILKISELDHQKFNQDVEFQQFFIDDILCNPQFTVIRAFIENTLEDILDSLPTNIFQNYQSLVTSDPKSLEQRSGLLHLLAFEGCVSILKMILECINFKTQKYNAITSKNTDTNKTNETFKYEGKNVLNLLQGLVEQYGIDIEDEQGNTPLHEATKGGNLNMLSYLVGQGANTRRRNHRGDSAVHLAVWFDHLEAIRFLMENGCDITAANKGGYTALHWAAQMGYLDVCKFLIERGMDANQPNKSGQSSLHAACLEGHLHVLKWLVESEHADIHIADEDGFTVLHRAVQENHLDVCKYLIERGVDVNLRNVDGTGAILLACGKGVLDIVKLLVEYGQADIHITDNDGFQVLHCAAQEGHLDVCKYLIERGVDVNLRSNDGTAAIFLAAGQGHLDVVNWLVEYEGTDIHVVDNDGYTALHWAAQEGYLDICKRLIKKSTDINVTDNEGFTALHWAALRGQLDVCKFLIEKGIDVNLRNKNGFTPLHSASFGKCLDVVMCLVECNKTDINVATDSGFTALHCSAQEGHLDLCKYLVERGIDVKLRTEDGHSALHAAVITGHLDVVKFLVDCRHLDINVTTNDGFTALHCAAQQGHLEICKFLIERGVDINLRDKAGYCALHAACYYGRPDVVKLLIEWGHADINVANNDGFTALHWAAQQGHLDICKFLIERGIDVNLRHEDGHSALHSASRNGHTDVVKLLVDCGHVDINVADNDGLTALHCAAKDGHLDTCKVFVERGIDANLCDRNGFTPLHLAVLEDQLEVTKFLVVAGADVNIRSSDGVNALEEATQRGHQSIVEFLTQAGRGNINAGHNT